MSYYSEVVQHLQWAVMDIQRVGMLIDMNKVLELRALTEAKKIQNKETFERCLGYPFNPNAPQQVMGMFTYDLGIPLQDGSDAIALLKTTISEPRLKPIVEGIIEYRELMKLGGTYLKPEPWSDGRVRSSFRTYGTLTWRLSSKEPDLQNLPRSAVQGINIKDIYIAPPGFVLLELDYSALEDRIPSYASGCKVLIEMFETGKNTHLYRATIIFGRPITDKHQQAEEYNFSKRFVYSRNYGAGLRLVAEKLLQDTHEWHPESELAPMAKRLDEGIPEILAWKNKCWKDAEETGMLYDGFGVSRVLFEPPGQRRQVAYSSPTQTTASGIMNRSMVRIYLNKHTLHPDTKCNCQVHDSLMFEVREDLVEQEARKIKAFMEHPVTIFGRPDVVFPVEAKWGKSWGTMKDLKL